MKNVLNKMMNKIQFIAENNIVVSYYYIYKAKKLFDARDIAPRQLYREWRQITKDYSMGHISPREMYKQALDYARKYKLA